MSKKIAVNHHISGPLLTALVFSVSYVTQEQDLGLVTFLRGLFSSVSFGLIVSIFTFMPPKKYSWIPNIALILFLVFDSTHILVNGSHINIEFYHFILKSSFTASAFNGSYFEILLYVITAWFCSLWISRLKAFDIKLKFWLPIAFSIFILDLFIPIDISSTNWAQQNFIVTNINNQRTSSFLTDEFTSKDNDQLVQDLDAQKFLPITKRPHPNIVVLVLEGFSQMYVELGLAPEIKKIQEEGVTVRNFISNQLQTNRGLYALFCADYPNLVAFEAKSDLLASSLINKKCLPHSLKKIGYENYFLQSAFLSFMRKDLFAKNSGYDFAVGADSFKQEQIISSWGIPDSLLLESVYKVLVEKNGHARPKFISALTSGTHHPFVTPISTGDLPTAIQYTDMAVGKLYEALKKDKLLGNTLLIITSDESKTISPRFPDIYSNWGLLTMVGADLKKQSVEKVFSQVDLSNSVLDFLNKAENFDLPGRSIFRRYKKPRSIFMGNTYSKRIYMTLEKSSYLLCDHFLNCVVKTGRKDLFSDEYTKRSATEEEIQKLKSFVVHNDLTFSKLNQSILFQELNIIAPGGLAHGVLEEFKTTPAINKNLKYQIEKENTNPVEIQYSFYKCGDPSTLKSKSKIIKNKTQSLLIKVPSDLLDENLCHSLHVLNKTKKDISIKRIMLTQ